VSRCARASRRTAARRRQSITGVARQMSAEKIVDAHLPAQAEAGTLPRQPAAQIALQEGVELQQCSIPVAALARPFDGRQDARAKVMSVQAETVILA